MSENNKMEDIKRNQDPAKIDLIGIVSDFLYGIKKLWIILIALIVGCTLRSYISTTRSYTPQYEASATMAVVTTSGNNIDTQSAQQMASVFPYVLTSGVLADVVADAMGVSSLPGTISVKAEENANLLTMTVTSNDPQMAYDLLHKVIEYYPQVGEFVFGQTKLQILDETGVPETGNKEIVIRGSYKKGALQGVALSALILVIYVLMHKTVKSTNELKKQINLSHLASIPYVKIKKRRNHKEAPLCVLNQRVPDLYLESMRNLCMRILKEVEEKNLKTLLVTSSIPGEGKTTVAANLAILMARQGKKVILVDCDLRSPAIANVLGDSNLHKGTSAVLKNKSLLEQELCTVQVGGEKTMQVLYGGESNKSDAALLASHQMESLINQLCEQADVVILDTAPAQLLADASMMARYVDSALYVIRYDHTKMNRIREGIQALDMSGINMLGYIFNGDLSAKGKRYSYSYGYGYNYGHYGHYSRQGKLRDTGKREDASGRIMKP